MDPKADYNWSDAHNLAPHRNPTHQERQLATLLSNAHAIADGKIPPAYIEQPVKVGLDKTIHSGKS